MLVEDLRARWAIIFIVLVLTAIWNIPNFVKVSDDDSWDKIVWGLDIQGGLHLVMGVDTEGVVRETSKRLSSSLKAEMEDEGIKLQQLNLIDQAKGEINIDFASEQDRIKGVKYINDSRYAVQLQILKEEGSVIVVRFLEVYIRDFKKRIVEQAIETIRNRIDEFGVAEPSITAQGSNRILVQLPGIKDTKQAKELINRTARLEFMIVVEQGDHNLDLHQLRLEAEQKGNFEFFAGGKKKDKEEKAPEGAPSEAGDSGNKDELAVAGSSTKRKLPYSKYVAEVNEQLKGKLPKDSLLLFEKAENALEMKASTMTPYLVKADGDVGGDDLKDAYVSYDNYNRPIVSFRFNANGAKKFGDLTGANVNKRLAVVLDRVIKTAPSINERISESGQITLGSSTNMEETLKEAQMIAMSLRAGALPAALTQLEERTVGPTLGTESIEKAKFAGLVGGLLVILFMLFYYKTFGIIANLALALNILMVMAVLSSLRATLTLPGVAGIVLTVGMAVDANVIIFERIKEELSKGSALSLAVKEGFARALSAILDANITTAAVCVVLMYYGTGPVRGFAVTLIIGIVTSMFTAIFFSRAIFDFATQRLGYKKLSV